MRNIYNSGLLEIYPNNSKTYEKIKVTLNLKRNKLFQSIELNNVDPKDSFLNNDYFNFNQSQESDHYEKQTTKIETNEITKFFLIKFSK